MSLNKTPLRSDILIAANKNSQAPTAARDFAKAYTDYARDALAGSSLPTFVGTEQNKLSIKLLESIVNPVIGTPDKFARAWVDGILEFWTIPPIAFAGGSGAGVVTVFAGYPALYAALFPLFSNVLNTKEQFATGLATALDTATKTVVATLTLPPEGPIPYNLT